MADVGAIGGNGLQTEGTLLGTQMGIFCGVHVGGEMSPLLLDATRNDTSGNPTASSQSHPRPGIFKDIWWKVRAGQRKFSIDCNYGGGTPRPRIILKANPALGIPADLISTAPAGAGWVTILLTVTVYATGVLSVWRERTDTNLAVTYLWDHIQTG